MVIGAALWLDNKKSQPENESVAALDEVIQTDYFMEDYSITTTDIKGNPFRWLSGSKLEHFSNGDTTLIEPKLQFSQQEQHWLLVAKNGSFQEKDKIILDGGVKIQQLNGKEKALNIETEHLDISLTENIASTNSKVTVSNENGQINAIGMNINFNQHQLRLLSQVKGHYVFK